MEITTIKLSKSTKERLDKLRVYRRESYDEVLDNILSILNIARINPEKAKYKLIEIDKLHLRVQGKPVIKQKK